MQSFLLVKQMKNYQLYLKKKLVENQEYVLNFKEFLMIDY